MTDGVKTGAAIKVPGPADDGRPPVRPVGISQNPVRTVSADGDCRKTGRCIKKVRRRRSASGTQQKSRTDFSALHLKSTMNYGQAAASWD